MFNFQTLFFSPDRTKALLLLLLVALVYLPFLKNPLVFDDYALIGGGAISYYADAMFKLDLRWFSYVTLGVTWVFAGEDPPVYRIQNLLLHGINVLLLFQLLRMWFSVFTLVPENNSKANWGAWLGALVFACHPLAVYGVGYLVQRSILMATLFTLLMHLAYLRGLLEGNKRYIWLAVAAYFVAVFSKEHSLLAPAILIPLTWVLKDRVKVSGRTLLFAWGGFALVALLVVMRIKDLLGQPYERDAAALFGSADLLKDMPQLHLLSVLTQAGLFFKYLFLIFVPNPAWMSIDMREPFILNWREWINWSGMFAYWVYGAIGLLCLRRGGRYALFGLAMLYPWCMFPVEFASVRVQEVFVLYRAYLWMPGLMMLWVLIVANMSSRRIMLAAGLLVLLFVPLAWERLWVFADNYRLWDNAVQLLHGEDRLGAQRTYFNRGHYAAQEKKDWTGAIEDYKKSLQINSSFPLVRLTLAEAYANAGRKREALAEYDRVIAENPANADAYFGKSFLLKSQQDRTGAMELMKTSCALGKSLACSLMKLNVPKNTNSSFVAPPQSP